MRRTVTLWNVRRHVDNLRENFCVNIEIDTNRPGDGTRRYTLTVMKNGEPLASKYCNGSREAVVWLDGLRVGLELHYE